MADIHPTVDALEKFAQGRLPIQESARWELHISECEECGQILANAGSDTFMDLLKEQTQTDVPIVAKAVHPAILELPAVLKSHSRYVVQKRLGQGGMGMVYHAIHRLMNRPVALKIIRAELLATPLAVSRFRREVQTAAQLVHPNIVTAFDAEEVHGVHFLVMEYVDGKSLDELVKQKGLLPYELVCSIGRQIAQGLHHAHSLGMIHRDIKPSNVMITRQRKVKILDFGLARWSGKHGEPALPQITRDGSNLGTLMYSAPEQRKSASDVDARADLYSLGATLAFLLTGKPPPLQLEESNEANLILPDDTPSELKQLIRDLLQFTPDDRPQSAKAVADILSGMVASSGIQPDQPASTRKLRLALLASLIVLFTLLAIVISNWLYNPSMLQTNALQQTAPLASDQRNSTRLPTVSSPEAKVRNNSDDNWQSLLPLINPQKNAVAGTWLLVEDGLEAGSVRGGRLAIPVIVPAEYDFRVRFTRKTGQHSVGVVLLHGGKQCTFELDAWEQHLAGFQNIAGQNMMQNSTRQPDYKLENNRQYELLIQVRANTMRAILNGRQVTEYQGDGSDLSVDKRYWEMPNNSTLGLLAWESWTIFHSVELRPIK